MRNLLIASLTLTALALAPASKSEKPKMNKLTPILTVEKIEPSLPFWVDKLGFEKIAEVPEGDHLGFVMLKKGDVEIMYQSRQSMVKDLPTVAKSLKEAPSFMYIDVDSIDAVIEALKGAEVIVPKRKTFYGATEFCVREPGGHYVSFAEMVPEDPEKSKD